MRQIHQNNIAAGVLVLLWISGGYGMQMRCDPSLDAAEWPLSLGMVCIDKHKP
jgi:hypothetical protein